MRALVTGATGFVGDHLVRHLVESGDEVVGTYIPAAGLPPFEKVAGCEYLKCDVTEANTVTSIVSRFRPDAVYHLAAIAFVPEAEDDFNRTLAINVGGVNNVVRACHLAQLGSALLFISSAEVYGRTVAKNLPLTEETPINPANNYSLSKAMGELVVHRYAQFGYVRGIIARPFNHIGPKQNDRFVVSSFARQLARIAKGDVEPIIRVGNLTAQRDFSDVRDIVRAYRLAVLNGSGVFNLCSGQAVPISQILEDLIEISGVEVKVEQDPARMRASETPILYGSYAKAERELGWRPQIDLKESLRDVYNMWLAA